MDYKIKKIMFIFCDDEKLLKINIRHLGSDYLTDVIAFDYSSLPFVSGEIYVSIERVKSNAKKFNVSFDNELFRVIIHGVLHLCGYNDKSSEGKKKMKKKEDEFLSLIA
jgi:probable rRNA maturation factor